MESYVHAIGLFLISPALGLDPELVLKDMRRADAGKAFSMPLPDFERSMTLTQLQAIAQEHLTKITPEHASKMLRELERKGIAVMLERSRIALENRDAPTHKSKLSVDNCDVNVLVIAATRLLDWRHFFACSAVDETGESVRIPTLPLVTATPALAKYIMRTREGEIWLLYLRLDACEGMSGLFSGMLPLNAQSTTS